MSAIAVLPPEQPAAVAPAPAADPQTSVLAVIARAAADPNVDVSKMMALLDVQERIIKRAAEMEFRKAMSGFQSECPVIVKTVPGGATNTGVVAYKYAPIDHIIRAVQPLLDKHGLSYQLNPEFPDGKVRVVCRVHHIAGHSEPTSVEMPLGARTGIMSAPQQVAAGITFCTRYALTSAFGIITGNSDTDAREQTPSKRQQTASQPPPQSLDQDLNELREPVPLSQPAKIINAAQLKRLHAIASAKWAKHEAKTVIGWCGFESSKDVTVDKYDAICELLEQGPQVHEVKDYPDPYDYPGQRIRLAGNIYRPNAESTGWEAVPDASS